MLNFAETIRAHRHAEWFYFPGSDLIQVKKMNMVAPVKQPQFEKTLDMAKMQLLENGAFLIVSELCKRRPSLSGMVSRLSSKLVSDSNRTNISYEVFASPRNVKFIETEYAVPLEQFTACMEEVDAMFQRKLFDVHFPIECRTTAGEGGYLSPTQGEASAFIAFHMYKGMDESSYFHWVHEMMKKYNGRPHWGKVNRYEKSNIDYFYPNAQQFNTIRKEQDPKNIFLTSYFKRIFG